MMRTGSITARGCCCAGSRAAASTAPEETIANVRDAYKRDSALLRRFRSQEVFRSERNLPHTDAGSIVDGITNGGRDDCDRGLPGAGRRRVQIINQDRVDFGKRVAEPQNRIAYPVFGSDDTSYPVELDFFEQRAADALDYLTFHLVAETIGTYDGARVDARGDFRHLDDAIVLINDDFGNHGAVAVKALVQDAGEAPAGDHAGVSGVERVTAFGRRTRIPARSLCDAVDDIDEARIRQMAQTVLDGVRLQAGS